MANLNLQYKTRYGLDWPVEVTDLQIELILAKKWKLKPYCHADMDGPDVLLLRAIRKLFTPSEFKIHRWVELQARSWALEDFSVWLGAAATGKSNSAGLFAVLDWICDPLETYIAMASTSVPMLKTRSFESVIRYFRILKRNPHFLVPGKEAPSQNAIINDNDSGTDATIKASIRGVAVAEGAEARAIARLAGAHMPFTTIILDEGSALPAAAANARFNARAGAKRFRFLSLANPTGFQDEATKFCEPLEGWSTVSASSEQWRSRYGLVLHFDGMQSPAIEEPEEYPFLINQSQIDVMLQEEGGNENSPYIHTMVRGFPPAQGAANTVLTPMDIQTFGMADLAEWIPDSYYIQVAGLDPAFVSHGDGCILQTARVGWLKHGLFGIGFDDPVRLTLDAESMRPMTYQTVDQTKAILDQRGVPIENLCVDDSGTQSVADIIEVETGRVPIRLNFAARASDTREGEKPRYRNAVTEIWHLVAKLGRERQLRALPGPVQQQFCDRRYVHSLVPLALESKLEYKKRVGGRSPDEGDAAALCCYAATLRGLTPGQQGPTGGQPMSPPMMSGGPAKKTLRPTYESIDMARFSVYANR